MTIMYLKTLTCVFHEVSQPSILIGCHTYPRDNPCNTPANWPDDNSQSRSSVPGNRKSDGENAPTTKYGGHRKQPG